METLSQISGETVHFVERVGTEAVYIDKVEARQNAVRMVSRVGSRIPVVLLPRWEGYARQPFRRESQRDLEALGCTPADGIHDYRLGGI